MGYRNQSGRSTYRDVSRESSGELERQVAASAVSFLGGEIIGLAKANKARKARNNAAMIQSEANKVKLMSDIGNLATEKGVDQSSLKATAKGVVDSFAESKLAVDQSTGDYLRTDSLGLEVDRAEDLKRIAQGSDFVNSIGSDIDANEYHIGKLQELQAEGRVGDPQKGGVSLETVSPYLLAVVLGDETGNNVPIKEEYKTEYDSELGWTTTIVYSGDSIAQINKENGIEGDEHTVDTKSLASLLDDPNRNPNNYYGYVITSDYTEIQNNSAASVLNEDKNAIDSQFYTSTGTKNISAGINRLQKVDTKSLEYKTVHSYISPTMEASAKDTMRGNNPELILANVKAYTHYDEDKDEYYFLNPRVDNKGLLEYDSNGDVVFDDERTVLVRDGILELDLTNPNEARKVLTEMFSQEFLESRNAYDKRTQTPIGNAYTLPRKTNPTEPDLERNRNKQIINKFINEVSRAQKDGSFEDDEIRVKKVSLLLKGVYNSGDTSYDSQNKLFIVDTKAVYNDEGEVVVKGERISFDYDPNDPDALGRLRQEIETNLKVSDEATQEGAVIRESTKKEKEDAKARAETLEKERSLKDSKKDYEEFKENFPDIVYSDGRILDEEALMDKLQDYYPNLKYDTVWDGEVESLKIGGELITDAGGKGGGNYDADSIMEIVYKQSKKSKTKKTETKKTETEAEHPLAEQMKEAKK
tara:strand:+ start:1404 stop:3503 length:2100 start_codon:yes stop_codon:yes gene_type:complete